MSKVLIISLYICMHKLVHLKTIEETSIAKPKLSNDINFKETLRVVEVYTSFRHVMDAFPLLSKLLRLETTLKHFVLWKCWVSYLKEKCFISFIFYINWYSESSVIELFGPSDFWRVLTVMSSPSLVDQKKLFTDVLEE